MSLTKVMFNCDISVKKPIKSFFLINFVGLTAYTTQQGLGGLLIIPYNLFLINSLCNCKLKNSRHDSGFISSLSQ